MANWGITTQSGASDTGAQDWAYAMGGSFAVSGQQLDSVSVYARSGSGPFRVGVYQGGTADNDADTATLIEDLGVVTPSAAGWQTASSSSNPALPSSDRLFIVVNNYNGGATDAALRHFDSPTGDIGGMSRDWQWQLHTTVFPSTIPASTFASSTVYVAAYITHSDAAVTSTISITLKNLDADVVRGNLANLQWAWFPTTFPVATNLPTSAGTVETTDASGNLVITVDSAAGTTGWLALYSGANQWQAAYKVTTA